jgi:hypothetical protein
MAASTHLDPNYNARLALREGSRRGTDCFSGDGMCASHVGGKDGHHFPWVIGVRAKFCGAQGAFVIA